MKERYSHELPKWMKLLGIWRINQDSIDFVWGYFAPKFGFEFVAHRGGYFDQRWAITFALLWGVFHVRLPFKTKLSEGCNTPKYGFAIHSNVFWWYTGGKYDNSIGQCCGNDQWITWDLPFFSHVFDGHWIEDKDRNWVIMDKSVRPWDFREAHAYTETHPYRYTLRSGKTQEVTATCTVEKCKWHRKWFPFLTMVEHVIAVKFSDEVGEERGSWKGGCLGCSYKLLPNETVEECLRRMERERKF